MSSERMTRRKFLRVGAGALAAVPALFAKNDAIARAQGEGGILPDGGTAPAELDAAGDFEVVRQFIAGGEFLDPKTFLGRILQDAKTGATVVLSNDVRDALVSSFIEKGPVDPTLDDLSAAAREGLWGRALSKLTPDHVAFLDSDHSLIFKQSDTPQPALYVGADGQERAVRYNTTNPYYKPSVKWYEGMGLVGTDDVRVTHNWNPDTQEWQELIFKNGTNWENRYVLLGTAEQRNAKRLDRLLEALGPHAIETITGPTGDAIYIVVGGNYGLQIPGNVDQLKAAFSLLTQGNPKAIEEFIKLGLGGIAGGTTPEMFKTEYQGFGAAPTHKNNVGIIACNEQLLNPKDYKEDAMIFIIVTETRGIYNYQHLEWDGEEETWKLSSIDRLMDLEDTKLEKDLWGLYWARDSSGLAEEHIKNILYFANYQLPPNLQVPLS